MKTTILLAAMLLFASVSRAQVYEESRPTAPPPAPAASADNSSNYTPDYDDNCCLTVPLEISPSSSTALTCSAPAPAAPASASAHGDANWTPSTYVPYRKAVSQGRPQQASQQSKSQPAASANIPDQFRQLVLEKRAGQQNAASSSSQGQTQLHAQSISLGDIARQTREQQATAPKAQMVMKQDRQGNAVLAPKKQ